MQRALGVVGVAASVGFGLLGAHVTSGAADAFDSSVAGRVHLAVSPVWRWFFEHFTRLGQGDVLTAVTAVVVGVLLARRQWLPALLCGFAQGGGATLNYLLKLYFARARPRYADPRLVEAGSLSFPSGHTMMTLVFVGFGLYMYLRRPRSTLQRTGAVAAACIWCLLMGASRIYLGNHYASDVLGGYLAGVAWLSVAVALNEKAGRSEVRSQ